MKARITLIALTAMLLSATQVMAKESHAKAYRKAEKKIKKFTAKVLR